MVCGAALALACTAVGLILILVLNLVVALLAGAFF